MIPINNVDGIGIRDVIDRKDADKVFKSLKQAVMSKRQTGTKDIVKICLK